VKEIRGAGDWFDLTTAQGCRTALTSVKPTAYT
jgi:hypothetical protein